MKVEIEWTEEVAYVSTIEVDEAAIRLWLTMDHDGEYHPEKDDPSKPITAEDVKEWLTSGEESEWFDQCDTTVDFLSVDERDLVRVNEVKA